MRLTALIHQHILSKETEIAALEQALREERAYLHALLEIFHQLYPPRSDARKLRPQSAPALARQAILAHQIPLHIDTLLHHIGRTPTANTRAALAAQLYRHAYRRTVFTRSAPHTFGLIELGHPHHPLPRRSPAPPPTTS